MVYPNNIDGFPSTPIQSGYEIEPDHVSNLYNYISGVESTLGLHPNTIFNTVSDRITQLEQTQISLNVIDPLIFNSGTQTLSMNKADYLNSGFLSKDDWAAFNSRVNSVNNKTGNDVTLTTSDISEGTNLYYTDGRVSGVIQNTVPNISAISPVFFNNSIISIQSGSPTQDGFISKGDWNIFNGKQNSLGFTPINKSGDTINGLFTTTSGIEPNISGTQNIGNLDKPFDAAYFNKIFLDSKQFRPELLSVPNMIRVSQYAQGFTSIYDAVASISGNASALKPYVVFVEPGNYSEPYIDLPSYVSIVGRDEDTVIVTPKGSNTIFNMNPNSTISFITINDGAIGFPAVTINNPQNFILMHKVALNNCDKGVSVTANNNSTDNWMYFEYVDSTQDFGAQPCFNFQCTSGTKLNVSCENFYPIAGISNPAIAMNCAGQGLKVTMRASAFLGTNNTGEALHIEDGAEVSFESIKFQNWGKAINNPNVGAGCIINGNINIINCVEDLNIANPFTNGAIQGILSIPKSTIDPLVDMTLMTQNPDGSRSTIMGDLYTGKNTNNLLYTNPLITSMATMGLTNGGTIIQYPISSGLKIGISGGYGYLDTDATDWTKTQYVSWNTQDFNLLANDDVYLYVDPNGNIQKSYSSINGDYSKILLGRAVCTATSVLLVGSISMDAVHTNNKFDEYLRDVFGPIVAEGMAITQSGTNKINSAGGEYYFSSHNWSPIAKTPVPNFYEFYHNTGSWTARLNTSGVINTMQFDDLTNLSGITTNFYTRHGLWYQGGSDKHLFVYGQAQYSGLELAKSASTPIPSSIFSNAIVPVADIIVQNGSGIVLIYDTRPTPQYKSPILNSATNILYHSQLLGLTNGDDHTQYLLTNGDRDLTGDQSFGNNNITNVNLINGINLSSHESGHLPNGIDPLDSAAPTTNLSASTTNHVGIQNSFARSDHSHAITSVGLPSTINTVNQSGTSSSFAKLDHIHAHGQQTDSTLHSLASVTTTGFLSMSDWILFNSKQPSGNYLNSGVNTTYIPEGGNLYYTDTRAKATISGTAPILVNNGLISTTLTQYTDTLARAVVSGASPISVTNAYISIPSGSISQDGFISKGDWGVFNNKLGVGTTTTAIVEGNNLYFTNARAIATISGTAPIIVNNGLISTTLTQYTDAMARATTSGSSPIVAINGLVTIQSGSQSQNGFLSSGDWGVFNAKQPSGNYVVTNTAASLTSLTTTTLSGNNLYLTNNGGIYALVSGNANIGTNAVPIYDIDTIELCTTRLSGLFAGSNISLAEGFIPTVSGNYQVGTLNLPLSDLYSNHVTSNLPSYSEIYMVGNATANQALQNTYVVVSGAFTNLGSSSDFSITANTHRVTYIGSDPITIKVTANVSAQAASNSQTMRLAIGKNKIAQSNYIDSRLVTSGLPSSTSNTWIGACTSGDYFQIMTTDITAANALTMISANLSIIKLI